MEEGLEDSSPSEELQPKDGKSSNLRGDPRSPLGNGDVKRFPDGDGAGMGIGISSIMPERTSIFMSIRESSIVRTALRLHGKETVVLWLMVVASVSRVGHLFLCGKRWAWLGKGTVVVKHGIQQLNAVRWPQDSDVLRLMVEFYISDVVKRMWDMSEMRLDYKEESLVDVFVWLSVKQAAMINVSMLNMPQTFSHSDDVLTYIDIILIVHRTWLECAESLRSADSYNQPTNIRDIQRGESIPTQI
ncbi:hypothetical protein Tco_0479380, partial [Tanacetum coccineum]